MTEIFSQLLAELQANAWYELTAVVFGIAYLLLAVRESILCWYAAFISTSIFLVIFWDVKLYMESALQIYYLGMAAYGWYQWQHGGDTDTKLDINRWRWQQHLVALSLILALTIISGGLLSAYTDARLPYADSFTTWGSIITTFMVARKILENWVYWLVIDSVSLYLYIDRSLYFTSLLFAAYLIIVLFGWYTWTRRYHQQVNA